jgi:hypothetical protein
VLEALLAEALGLTYPSPMKTLGSGVSGMTYPSPMKTACPPPHFGDIRSKTCCGVQEAKIVCFLLPQVLSPP